MTGKGPGDALIVPAAGSLMILLATKVAIEAFTLTSTGAAVAMPPTVTTALATVPR